MNFLDVDFWITGDQPRRARMNHIIPKPIGHDQKFIAETDQEHDVNQTLAGKASVIKDDTVAAEVFGRGPDFDRHIDPIVSIQADLLRRALARYYKTAGKNDPIRIDIPPGYLCARVQKAEAERALNPGSMGTGSMGTVMKK